MPAEKVSNINNKHEGAGYGDTSVFELNLGYQPFVCLMCGPDYHLNIN